MNLKILFLIVFYYSAFLIVFANAGDSLTGVTHTIELNSTELSDDEIDTGGVFGTGVSFSRFLGFTAFGLGLPDETPTWFALLFATWQTAIFIFTVGFIIDSIWSG